MKSNFDKFSLDINKCRVEEIWQGHPTKRFYKIIKDDIMIIMDGSSYKNQIRNERLKQI